MLKCLGRDWAIFWDLDSRSTCLLFSPWLPCPILFSAVSVVQEFFLLEIPRFPNPVPQPGSFGFQARSVQSRVGTGFDLDSVRVRQVQWEFFKIVSCHDHCLEKVSLKPLSLASLFSWVIIEKQSIY